MDGKEATMSASDGGAAEAGRKDAPDARNGRVLSPAARRALAEAEARRARPEPDRPREVNGRGGPDPVRYGDWEVKGLASDF
jgi:hypothetical protein